MSKLIVYSKSCLLFTTTLPKIAIVTLFLLVPAGSLCAFFPKIAWSIISFQSKIAPPQSLCKTVNYEDKYKTSLKTAIDHINVETSPTPTKLCNFIMETTPNGQVIMRYNDKTLTFEYYTDSGTLLHKYLETACRRYVIVFKCPHLYTNMNDEIKRIYDQQKTKPHQKKIIVKQKINKFVRLGKLSDFNILQIVPQELPNISFADFKKQKTH